MNKPANFVKDACHKYPICNGGLCRDMEGCHNKFKVYCDICICKRCTRVPLPHNATAMDKHRWTGRDIVRGRTKLDKAYGKPKIIALLKAATDK